jgi:hypothetical protein
MAGIREGDKRAKVESAIGCNVLYLFPVRNMFFSGRLIEIRKVPRRSLGNAFYAAVRE